MEYMSTKEASEKWGRNMMRSTRCAKKQAACWVNKN